MVQNYVRIFCNGFYLRLFIFFFSQLVRLIANLSVHAEVGPKIAGDQDTVHFLLMILGKPWLMKLNITHKWALLLLGILIIAFSEHCPV